MSDQPPLCRRGQQMLELSRRVEARLVADAAKRALHQSWFDGETPDEITTVIEMQFGWAGEPNERRRSVTARVKRIRWQLEQFAAIMAYDSKFAETAIHSENFYWPLTIWRQRTGQYVGPKGDALRATDDYIRGMIDKRFHRPVRAR